MEITNLTNRIEVKAIAMLREAGYEGYFVGGCVRDAIIGREYSDIDITTSALPEETKAVFNDFKTIDTGIKHGTITVLMGDAPEGISSVEITTYRTEKSYSDNRHPDQVEFVKNITEDLVRRDFTINAIGCDEKGNLVDPFNGIEDIRAGIIRAAGNAEKRFEEDGLRIMRAMRFAAQLGFEIEKETEKAMVKKSHLLKNISKERIFTELKKLVISPYGGKVIDKYPQVLAQVLPHFGALDGFNQHNPHHKYDVLRHCIHCMENVRTTEQNIVYMKLAALFHDIGKPETFAYDKNGVGRCPGHAEKSSIYVEEILKNLKADSFTVQRVSLLTKYHDLLFKKDPVLLKKLLKKFGDQVLLEILELKRADNLAIGCEVSQLIFMFDEINLMIRNIVADNECFNLKALMVSGSEIVEATGAKGPRVGEILDKLLEQVIEGKIPNKKALLLKEAVQICNEI